MTTTSLRQVGQVLVLLADQVAQDALLDVVDVLDALGQVAVGHLPGTCCAYRRITMLTRVLGRRRAAS